MLMASWSILPHAQSTCPSNDVLGHNMEAISSVQYTSSVTAQTRNASRVASFMYTSERFANMYAVTASNIPITHSRASPHPNSVGALGAAAGPIGGRKELATLSAMALAPPLSDPVRDRRVSILYGGDRQGQRVIGTNQNKR